MRLLLVTPWPLASSGGAQRFALGMTMTLAAQGIEVTVAAGSGLLAHATPALHGAGWRERRLVLRAGGAGPANSAAGATIAQVASVEPDDAESGRDRRLLHRRIASWTRRRSPTETHTLDGLEPLADEARPDAVLFLPHYSACARQAAALAARRGVPFVLCPAIHLDAPAHTNARARGFYRSAALVCSLSDAERDWLVSHAGVPRSRTVVIGYGCTEIVDTPRRSEGAKPDGSRCEPLPREPHLLTVGAYAPHKQLDHQIRALVLLRDARGVPARLTIAGTPGDRAVVAALATLARRLNVDRHVTFKTDCRDAEIAALHRSADAFLFTSRSESFGVALFEAIAHGTAPVAYPHVVYRGHVESSGFGKVTASATPEALADAVVDVLKECGASANARRIEWLRARSWERVMAPLAEALEAPQLAAAL